MSFQTGSIDADGLARTSDGKLYVTLGTGSAIDSPTFSGSRAPVSRLACWGVPVCVASSGSIGNNGALTGHTALPFTYSGGLWMYFPANAIAAGVGAGFYWVVMSSTTAGTIYNSTYSGTGAPTVGTTTAFATTGPGAYTGATGEFGITIAVPAGALGISGKLLVSATTFNNNSAGTKTPRFRWNGAAGTVFGGAAQTTVTGLILESCLWNAGVTNRQFLAQKTFTSGSAVAISTVLTDTVDTTAATDVRLTVEHGTATDFMLINSGDVSYIPT